MVVSACGITLWYYIYSPALTITEPYRLIVQRGDNLQNVTMKLHKNCGLKHPKVFIWIAERMNVEKNLHAGRFEFLPTMNNREIAKLLRSGSTYTVNVTIRGSTDLNNIPVLLGKYLEPDKDSFQVMLDSNAYLSKYGFNKKTVAAMFIPNTYNMYWFTTADETLERFYKEYKRFWNIERRVKADSVGLTILEVSILASIIDKETNQVYEMPRIAGVYLNRLRKGWKLQADPTVKYALDSMSMKRILVEHTQVENPYNTYDIVGLPPSPICIPSVQAIDAVLNYEHHQYMYFCAKPDFSGLHIFAENLDEHNRNAKAYHRFLNQLERSSKIQKK